MNGVEITEEFLFGDSKADATIESTKIDKKEDEKNKEYDEMNDF